MKQLQQDLKDGSVDLVNLPRPNLRSGGVLVRTEYSVVSAGTETSMIELGQKSLVGKAFERPDLAKEVLQKARNDGLVSTYRSVNSRLEEPMPLGYSCAGEVIAVGDGVDSLSTGDRVACAGAGYATHAEVNYVPENLVVEIPEEATTRAAAFTTLGAIALQGIRRLNCTPGERVAVIGLGLVGQLAARLLDAYGFPVLGIDIDPSKVDAGLGNYLSAGSVPGEDDTERSSVEFGHGDGLDGVLITAATESNQPIEQAGDLLRENGTVSVVGDVGMDVPRDAYYEKELEVRLSRSYGPGRYDRTYEEKGLDYPIGWVRWTENRNMSEFLRLVADGRVEPSELITHEFAFDESRDAYDLLLKGEEPATGVLLEYDEFEANGQTLRMEGGTRRLESDTLSVGLIGTGSFARHTLLPTISGISRLRIEAVASATGRTAKSVAQKYDTSYVTTDYTEIIADDSIDIVVVATRHDLHAKVACKALDHGKDVHVEKPLALDRSELRSVLRAASESEGRLMVGYNRRFSSAADRIRGNFDRRETPLVAQYRVNTDRLPSDHWINDPEEGGGRIIGEVCHFVDFLQHVTGASPESVYAVSPSVNGDSPHENVQLVLTFDDGSQGTVTYTTLGDDSVAKEHVELFGNGCIEVVDNFKQGRLKLSQDKGFTAEFEALVEAIQEGKTSPIPLEELAMTSLATFATVDSLRDGQPVSIESLQSLLESTE